MSKTRLDYLRHGEPMGGSRFRGNGVDDPLSDLGWRQMRSSVGAFDDWQRVVCSPMQRCAAFAHWVGEQRDLPVEVVDDLREVGFGAWEGCSREQLKQSRRAEYDAFYVDPVNNRPGGAEPLDAFGRRVAAVFEDLVERYRGQQLLVVCHAGVIRATLGHVTRAPATTWYRAQVDYAAMSRFVHDPRGAWLAAHNWRPTL